MSRYGDPAGKDRAIKRLQEDASVADQVIEDLSRALEDSERVADRYREALVHIRQLTREDGAIAPLNGKKLLRILETAMWTKVEDR